MQIRFWGVRGSTCTSGPRFAEFGNHTPCVEVRCGSRLYVIDAGSGIAALGAALGADAPPEIDLLFSHLHLDHVSGLPFFKPVVLGKRLIRTYCGNLGGASAAETLNRLFAPPLFPIRLDELPGRFEHRGFRAGETLSLEGQTIETHLLNHPDGATGYRFEHRGRVFCYISDIEHSDPWPPPDLVAFIRDADLVVFDGMFSESEYPLCRGWGHSTWQKGLELCQPARVKSLAIFHLSPGHDDAYLREVEAEIQARMPGAFVAREGQAVTLEPVA